MTKHIETLESHPINFGAPASGIEIVPTDIVYWDGTNWAKADADTPATKYAWGICTRGGKGGDINSGVLGVARRATLFDDALGLTANAAVYLSAAAGAYTQTRPTTVGHLRQVIGWAFDTKRAHMDFAIPREQTHPWAVKGATSAYALLDSGNHGGPTLDATGETCLLQQTVPENATAVVKAVWYLAAEAVVAATTADITVGSALGNATQHDAITADATMANQVFDVTADTADEINAVDAATALDAASIIQPGAVLGAKFTSDQAGTDIMHVLGGHTVYKVV